MESNLRCLLTLKWVLGGLCYYSKWDEECGCYKYSLFLAPIVGNDLLAGPNVSLSVSVVRAPCAHLSLERRRGPVLAQPERHAFPFCLMVNLAADIMAAVGSQGFLPDNPGAGWPAPWPWRTWLHEETTGPPAVRYRWVTWRTCIVCCTLFTPRPAVWRCTYLSNEWAVHSCSRVFPLGACSTAKVSFCTFGEGGEGVGVGSHKDSACP